MSWTEWYQKAVNSEQSCIHEWLAMSDLESVRPSSPAAFSDQSVMPTLSHPTPPLGLVGAVFLAVQRGTVRLSKIRTLGVLIMGPLVLPSHPTP